jgi:iron donor protein CyaY
MIDYEERIDQVFLSMQQAIDAIDPDIVECFLGQGGCQVKFFDGSRLILSKQTAVHQLWLVWTKQAMGLHFDFDGKKWRSDKEPFRSLQDIVEEVFLAYQLTFKGVI